MTATLQRTYPWKLALFPLLELVLFITAVLVPNHLLSLLLVLLAGVLLSFSIHIFFHECVHWHSRYPQWINIIHSLFLGLPFDGYRVHHYNHHTYANNVEDFSTTWRVIDGNTSGFPPCQYAIGWPRQLKRAVREPHPFDPVMGDVNSIKSRIPLQKLALLILMVLLVLLSFKAFLLYLLLVYSGWAFSALHNYGQHLPTPEEVIVTYPNQLYNKLFFNNGLHWEHHHMPWLSWDQLTLDPHSKRISHPHLLEPCFKREHRTGC